MECFYWLNLSATLKPPLGPGDVCGLHHSCRVDLAAVETVPECGLPGLSETEGLECKEECLFLFVVREKHAEMKM